MKHVALIVMLQSKLPIDEAAQTVVQAKRNELKRQSMAKAV